MVKLIMASPNKQCDLDPAPTWIIKSSCMQLAPFIAYACNRSLQEGYLPTSQKSAVEEYRPISHVTFISKLIERVACNQITKYLEKNSLLPSCQSAYRRSHSTETALLKVFTELTDAIDRGEVTLVGLLDMSCAFDTVNYSILQERLALKLGIDDTALKWIDSYLSDRSQTVVVGGRARLWLRHYRHCA